MNTLTSAIQSGLNVSPAEALGIYTPTSELHGPVSVARGGELVVAQFVPELLGIVVLHGGYATRTGHIGRSPSEQHQEAEQSSDTFIKLPAEHILPQTVLTILEGSAVSTVVESTAADRLVLRGWQITIAQQLLQRSTRVDVNEVAALEGVGLNASVRMQRAATAILEFSSMHDLVANARLSA